MKTDDTFWQFKELYISCSYCVALFGQNMLREDAVEPRYNEGIKLTQFFKYLRSSLSWFPCKTIVFVLSKLSFLNLINIIVFSYGGLLY